MNLTHREAVGEAFSHDAMQYARSMTWQAVDTIAAGIRPGMQESEANALGSSVLEELGMDRIWHPVIVRFGENTLRTFKERSVADPVLADDDIFFIDLGAVWAAHEGDAGATFVRGDDPAMHACMRARKPRASFTTKSIITGAPPDARASHYTNSRRRAPMRTASG